MTQASAVAIDLKAMPRLEHLPGEGQAGLAELALVGERALGVEAEVAQKTRPANLATGRVEMVIGPPAIRGDDRLAPSEQLFGLLPMTGRSHAKDGSLLGEGAPEEPPLARLPPAGLISTEGRRSADRIP